jgi:hypothetical protein
MYKKLILSVALITIELITVLSSFFLIKARANNTNLILDSFYSSLTGEQQHYIESSFNLDERYIESETFQLDKGFYQIDLIYQSNMPSDASFGASVYLDGRYNDMIFFPMEDYVYLDESGKVHFETYIPYDECDITMIIQLEDDNGLQFINDKTRYVLVDNAHIQSDPRKTTLYCIGRMFIIFAVFDTILLIFCKYRKVTG